MGYTLNISASRNSGPESLTGSSSFSSPLPLFSRSPVLQALAVFRSPPHPPLCPLRAPFSRAPRSVPLRLSLSRHLFPFSSITCEIYTFPFPTSRRLRSSSLELFLHRVSEYILGTRGSNRLAEIYYRTNTLHRRI